MYKVIFTQFNYFNFMASKKVKFHSFALKFQEILDSFLKRSLLNICTKKAN